MFNNVSKGLKMARRSPAFNKKRQIVILSYTGLMKMTIFLIFIDAMPAIF